MLVASVRPGSRFRRSLTIDRLLSFSSQHAWLALPFLALPAVLPFWLTGFPETADGHLHLLRLALLDRYVGHGWLYPRWIPDFVLGRGYPLLNFYAPAVYYVAEGLHLLGLGFQHAFAVVCGLEILGAGLGMYLLAGDLLGYSQKAARLVAATAYMYAPYLLGNAFVRGAFPELGAQALLPWVLWAAHRLMTRGAPRRDIVPAALVLASLAITHNITLFFLPIVWVAYVAVLWWQGGRRRALLLWAGGAAGLAMLLSTFFWLPMAVERTYLSGAAYDISARFLHENVWSWQNFLDPNFFYKYGNDIPYRLGLVQFGLALVGIVLVRRRNAVWLFYVGLLLVTGLAITQWTLPVWLNSRLLLTVQFPWRLLSLMSVPLALFAGAILLPVRGRAARFAVAVALAVLIIVTQRPSPSWSTSMSLDSVAIRPPSVAQFEIDSGALGTSNSSEFLPRWVKTTRLSERERLPAAAHQVQLREASPFDFSMQVAGDAGSLRINTFYYPGWRAVLDGQTNLQPHPSTDLGLLTVDIPAGTHELALRWEGTLLARLAGAISLLSFLLAALWCLWLRPRQALALPLLVLFLFGCLAMFFRPSPKPVLSPSADVTTNSLYLLGYQLEPDDGQHMLLKAFWYTGRTPAADLRIRWQLLDRVGRVVSQAEGRPFYGTSSTDDWPPATLVPDQYRLQIPSTADAGSYQLAVLIEPQDGRPALSPVVIGTVALPTSLPPADHAAASIDVRFGESIVLQRYGLLVNGQPVSLDYGRPPIVHPGDRLEYLLFWQGSGPINENYHGFVHLLSQSGEALVERDQSAGSIYATSRLWDASQQQPDRYRLIVPQGSAAGLYTPAVGLYDISNNERLPVRAAEPAPQSSFYQLPPVKVLGKVAGISEHRLSARFGDFARFTGYSLDTPPQLHPGDSFRLELYYQALKKSDQNLTRFVQLHNPDLGMAAQDDGIPQRGENPTWSWEPGEQIREDLTLSIAPDAPPGRYTLAIGLYDAQNGGERVPITGDGDQFLPDSRLILKDLEIRPRQ